VCRTLFDSFLHKTSFSVDQCRVIGTVPERVTGSPIGDTLIICSVDINGAQNRSGCADYGKSDVPYGMAASAALGLQRSQF